MKIAHFISTKDPRACGVFSAAKTIALAQIQKGHFARCFVSMPRKKQKIDAIYNEDNIPLGLLRVTLNPVRILTNYKKIKSEIQYFHPDVLHLHSVYSINNYLATAAARKLRIPYVLSPHGGYAPKIRQRNQIIKRLFEMLFEKAIIKNASLILVVSIKEIGFMRTLPWTIPKMKLINNPLLFEYQNEAICQIQKEINCLFKIVYVGRLDIEHKGLDIAVRSISFLPREIQESIQLLFVAPRNNKSVKQLLDIAKKSGVQANIIFLGHRTGAKKIEIIKNADLLLLTSRWEAFGYCVLEAMALGVPVLVSEFVPLAELIKKCGCGWVSGLNEKTISDGIKQAFELDPIVLREIGNNGKVAASTEYNPHVIAEQVCQAYREVME